MEKSMCSRRCRLLQHAAHSPTDSSAAVRALALAVSAKNAHLNNDDAAAFLSKYVGPLVLKQEVQAPPVGSMTQPPPQVAFQLSYLYSSLSPIQ
eukprot:3833151-Amphidinium_carterae.1